MEIASLSSLVVQTQTTGLKNAVGNLFGKHLSTKNINSIMKTRFKFIPIGIITLLILSCDKNEKGNYIALCGKIINFQACDVDDIGNNLKWLNDIIITSKTD